MPFLPSNPHPEAERPPIAPPAAAAAAADAWTDRLAPVLPHRPHRPAPDRAALAERVPADERATVGRPITRLALTTPGGATA